MAKLSVNVIPVFSSAWIKSKSSAFLGVIGRGRVSRRGADAAVAFVDHVVFTESFRQAVLPSVARTFVEHFG